MDFGMSKEHQMMQQNIRKFCKKELDPIAYEIGFLVSNVSA
jgi:hypothetical protein